MSAGAVVRACARCAAPLELGPSLPYGLRVYCILCASIEGVSFEELVAAAAVALPDHAPADVVAAVRAVLGDLRRRADAAVS